MEVPTNLLEQIVFNTRPKKGEHILIVMDKSIHEMQLSQPLQTNSKQFRIAVTYLSVYNSILKLQIQIIKFIARNHFLTKI